MISRKQEELPRTALITGASSGIGLDLAKLFARDGVDLILTARREERLREIATDLEQSSGITATVIPCDLARENGSAVLREEVERLGLEVDALVNNAGFGALGYYHEMEPDRITDMIRVNVEAVARLTRFFVPGMVSRGRGRVMQVASTASFMPGPQMALYYASKAFVLSLSEAIATELRGTGVTVTALCPGPTRTEFQSAAGMGLPRRLRRAWMESEEVARQGYEGMLNGERIVVPGAANKIMTQAVRVLPRRVMTALVNRVQEGRRSE